MAEKTCFPALAVDDLTSKESDPTSEGDLEQSNQGEGDNAHSHEPTDPRLEVAGAIFDDDGSLCLAAYSDLKLLFADVEVWSDPEKPGVRENEFGSLEGVRMWNDEQSRQRGRLYKGWIANRKGSCTRRGGVSQRWFSVQTWGSWRLAFLLAKLQRALWDQCPARTSAMPEIQDFEAKLEESSTSSVEPGAIACDVDSASDFMASQNSVEMSSQKRRRLRIFRKEHPERLHGAASVVFSQFEPLINRLLDTDELGLNPSPFDLQALAATCSGFRHLREPLIALPCISGKHIKSHEMHDASEKKMQRVRLQGKQWPLKDWCQPLHRVCAKQSRVTVAALVGLPAPQQLVSPLEYAFRIFARRRGSVTLNTAVSLGDLDAVRYRILQGSNPTEALALAVYWMRLHLVDYLLASGANPNGCKGTAAPLHIALQLWHKDIPGADLILQGLLRHKPDLNDPIWPVPSLRPDGLLKKTDPPKPDVGFHLPSSITNLPFVRCGDPPLAWLMTVHAEACGGDKARFPKQEERIRKLSRLLVDYGASPEKLSRRQAMSLRELMQPGASVLS
eukprot:gnl/MRDRNA2_/MRDRNA2_27756_c0_seq1.p1 gnl/MRDRNA2_/MRDRNA2_27756_c0~~gnl/MRDRNA2_/MRDRNA2_27756_c0_seq1.p1  ORF type:complete len:562 (+),score=92.55 gnl/MRDRNA2_/MRDRNA2_27756_c0_seq1:85-1770(+)